MYLSVFRYLFLAGETGERLDRFKVSQVSMDAIALLPFVKLTSPKKLQKYHALKTIGLYSCL